MIPLELAGKWVEWNDLLKNDCNGLNNLISKSEYGVILIRTKQWNG